MKRRVLVVDDDEAVVDALKMLVSAAGYFVVTAENATEALRVIRRNPPDAILCDLAMPEMDGGELIRSLKCSPETGSIPVVLMSGYDKSKAANADAAAFLSKPFQMADMVVAIESAIREHITAFSC